MLNEIEEKLKCLILDENKVVTYKFASKYLNVHASEAKKILADFFETYKDQYSLNSYYFIIGIKHDNDVKDFEATLISYSELEVAKSSYSSAPSFHIYCVYKGNQVDTTVLYAVDYNPDEQIDLKRLSVIHNPNVKIQPSSEVSHVSANKNEVNQNNSPIKTQAHDKNQLKPSAKKNSPDIFNAFQKKSNEVSKSSPKTDSKKANVKNDSMEMKKNENVVKKGSNAQKSNNSSVKQLFSAQSEKNSSVPSSNKTTTHKKVEIDSLQKVTKNEPKKLQAKRSKSNLNSESEGSDSETSKPKKKHKRIVAIEDSDSENEEAMDIAQRNLFNNGDKVDAENVTIEDEEIIPPTPPSSNYKTMMKTVNTFSTDGEFLVTKKEKQCVTVADEDVQPPKPSKDPASKKGLVNKKQSSLTAFFKHR